LNFENDYQAWYKELKDENQKLDREFEEYRTATRTELVRLRKTIQEARQENERLEAELNEIKGVLVYW
jgi:predicted  nucleic acid-binding Zn-ribbon protein